MNSTVERNKQNNKDRVHIIFGVIFGVIIGMILMKLFC